MTVFQRLKNLWGTRSNLLIDAGIPGFRHGDVAKVDRLSAYLPWDAVDDDGLFILKGKRPDESEGLVFTIEIFPQTGVTDEMEKSLLGITSALTPNAVVAITAYASPAVEGLTELMLPDAPKADAFTPLSPNAQSLMNAAIKSAIANLNRGARHQVTPGAPVVIRHWRVWLSVVMPGANPFDEKLREATLTARRAISAVLEQSGLFMGHWDAHTLVGTVAELMNPQSVRSQTFVRPAANIFESPSSQIMKGDTEVTITKHHVRFSDSTLMSGATHEDNAVHAVGLSVESYPERKWSLLTATGLLGESTRGGSQIPCPFMLTSIISLLDNASERVKAEGHRMRAMQMSKTPISQLSPWYPEKAQQWTLAVKSFQTEGGLARVSHQMVLFAPAGSEAEAVHAAQSIARKVGVEMRRTTCLHAQTLLAALPMAAGPLMAQDLKQMCRLQRRTLATGIYGAPVMTEWQGTGPRDDRDRRTPLLTLIGRRGQIMHVDPFANASGNYSMTIVGKPGSGKSVVMNQLAFSTLAQGGLVWIIDVGRSYEKMAGVLDGEFLVFDKDHIWDLNPFAILNALSGDDRNEGIESVVAILGELVSPGRPLPDLERSVLINCVASAAISAEREGRLATLLDLDLAIAKLAVNDRRLDDLRMQLEPYLNGPLSCWFDGSGRPVNFTNRFTVLELEGLSAHPALRQAVLMTLMLWIEKTMARDRSTVKLVLIDEAWDLMGSGHSGKFIASGFRRARKHKGGFVVATQSLADFFKSETAQAAWQCADTRLTLRQDSEVLSALESQGLMTTDAWFRAALGSLTTVRGAWSEMIVKVGDAPPAIGRLVLDRFSQVLFSSLPAEVTAVNAWRRAGATMTTAVQAVAHGFMTPSHEAIETLKRMTQKTHE
ncbi:MAG: TraC family protein [Sutterella wadsworthensis]|nr:TraC family protein [Sutterella wadsworthensis]